MPNRAITALTEILRPEIDLSKSRLEALCLMVLGMMIRFQVTDRQECSLHARRTCLDLAFSRTTVCCRPGR